MWVIDDFSGWLLVGIFLDCISHIGVSIGWTCIKVRLILLFCRFSNSSFAKANCLKPSNSVSIEICYVEIGFFVKTFSFMVDQSFMHHTDGKNRRATAPFACLLFCYSTQFHRLTWPVYLCRDFVLCNVGMFWSIVTVYLIFWRRRLRLLDIAQVVPLPSLFAGDKIFSMIFKMSKIRTAWYLLTVACHD